MTLGPFVVDTNVFVSGLITGDVDAPTARVVDGMLHRKFDFLLSVELLAEYRSVLLRPKIAARHGLNESEIDILLTEVAASAIVREPAIADEKAPDRDDQHLWSLLACHDGSVLVTGDGALLESPLPGRSALSPAAFVELLVKGS
ncbi:MAG TPA: putative toxin-antitoxin system toxin component, PIN family [Vicinamibacteria bacterium]|nr:putative toxin-antitoxin system toxin component, PIN family [Vicinamibacteria bacterium]